MITTTKSLLFTVVRNNKKIASVRCNVTGRYVKVADYLAYITTTDYSECQRAQDAEDLANRCIAMAAQRKREDALIAKALERKRALENAPKVVEVEQVKPSLWGKVKAVLNKKLF